MSLLVLWCVLLPYSCIKITITESEPSEENLSSDLSLGTGLNFSVKITKLDSKGEEATEELSVEGVEFMVRTSSCRS